MKSCLNGEDTVFPFTLKIRFDNLQIKVMFWASGVVCSENILWLYCY